MTSHIPDLPFPYKNFVKNSPSSATGQQSPFKKKMAPVPVVEDDSVDCVFCFEYI